LGQTGQGIQAADLASGTASDIAKQSLYARSQSNDIHRQAVSDLTKAAEDIFSSFGMDIPV
jgi:hypothetical protein